MAKVYIGNIDGVPYRFVEADDDICEKEYLMPDDCSKLLELKEIAVLNDKKNEALKFLKETDYIACKIADGSASISEYADVIEKRREAREIMNL